MQKIILNFGEIKIKAELFDTIIAGKFYRSLPYSVELTHWGQEMYGSIGIDLGTEKPVAQIPAGGLAYTNKGNYLCIFYGQEPAWPVELIGKLTGNWENLLSRDFINVTITKS